MKSLEGCGVKHLNPRKDYASCECEAPKGHEDEHRCACGGRWTREGQTVTPPPFPAIAGWS